MKRLKQTPRPNWQATVEELGFHFHTIDNETYWDESAAYEFTAAQVDDLEAATQTLEEMCLEAVEHIIRNDLYHRLNIPNRAIPLIEASWRHQHKNLIGRFDFAYDGVSPPQLLEYNADTPTSLLEASVIQWQWLEATHPQSDQFNSIHEKLVEAWKLIGQDVRGIHFTCAADHGEDRGTVAYLEDTAIQANLATTFIDLPHIGWNGNDFVDLHNNSIDCLFKLYPWEWLVQDEFADHIMNSSTLFIEPAWKMLLSNKGILAILWQLFPNHPNLLPAYFTSGQLNGAVARKPFLSREGANIRITNDNVIQATPGPYGAEGYVYQQAIDMPNFDGNYPVIGSWVIAGQAAGIGIREDKSAITTNNSRFIPHYFL